jgi:hypothetical protein
VDLYRAINLAEAVDIVSRIADTRILIFDVEMTLVPCGSTIEIILRNLRQAVETASSAPHVRQIWFVSNACVEITFAGVLNGVSYHSWFHSRKPAGPYRRLARLQDEIGGRTAVIGDQKLTDGILAWLLSAVFIELSIDCKEPAWPAFQRRLGNTCACILFRAST